MYGNGAATIAGGPVWSPLTGCAQGTVPPSLVPNAVPASERVRAELEDAVNRVHDAVSRAQRFADTMSGGAGAQAPITQKDVLPQRPGTMGQIQDLVDALHAALSMLENELARLSAI